MKACGEVGGKGQSFKAVVGCYTVDSVSNEMEKASTEDSLTIQVKTNDKILG